MLSYGFRSETSSCLDYGTITRDDITFGGYWILRDKPDVYQVYIKEGNEWKLYHDKFKVGEEEALKTWLELSYG